MNKSKTKYPSAGGADIETGDRDEKKQMYLPDRWMAGQETLILTVRSGEKREGTGRMEDERLEDREYQCYQCKREY